MRRKHILIGISASPGYHLPCRQPRRPSLAFTALEIRGIDRTSALPLAWWRHARIIASPSKRSHVQSRVPRDRRDGRRPDHVVCAPRANKTTERQGGGGGSWSRLTRQRASAADCSSRVGAFQRGKAIHDDAQARFLLGWRRRFANEESLAVGSHAIEHIVTLTRRTQVSPRADIRNV